MSLSLRNEKRPSESTPESRTESRRAKHTPVDDFPADDFGGITVRVTETKTGYTQLETEDAESRFMGVPAERADAIAQYAIAHPEVFTD